MTAAFPVPDALRRAIDARLRAHTPLCMAIDGPCGSGKTTLAAALCDAYGCDAVHMDDFFLPAARKTPERLAQPGGNVDSERFAAEVLPHLGQGAPFAYRPFCCRTQTLAAPRTVAPGSLLVVEGVYALLPAFAPAHGLRVFCTVSPAEQRRRLRARCAPAAFRRFETEWIPLEQRYFDAFQVASHCDLVIDNET